MLPDSEHNENLAPDVLSGALFNYQWRKIIVGILEKELPRLAPDTLTESELQEYQSRIDVLIEDIYTVESTAMSVQFKNAYRTDAQSILANTDTPITWQQGAYTVGSPTRITFSGAGLVSVTANCNIVANSLAQTNAWLRLSGLDNFSLEDSDAQRIGHRILLAFNFPVLPNDYIEFFVRSSIAGTVAVSSFLPRLNVLYFPN